MFMSVEGFATEWDQVWAIYTALIPTGVTLASSLLTQALIKWEERE